MPNLEPDAPIFLIGFMATGKTTVGRILAKRLGWTLVDLDEAVASQLNRTIPQIFEDEGEAGFRAHEARALSAVAADRRVVVATGGGAAAREENLQTMLRAGRVVALDVTPEEAVRRAGGGAGRPLLTAAGPDPLAAATKLLAAREPFYARAHLRVDTVGRSPDAVASEILAWLEPPA
jgi:shikimate kinase